MKKKKYISTTIIIVVLFLSSIGVWSLYPNILSHAKAKNYDDSIINYIIKNTKIYNYIIDKNMDNPKNGYLEYFRVNGGNITSYLKKQQDDEIANFYKKEDLLKQEKNIFYYAVDTKTNKTLSNTDDDLKKISKDKNLQKKYQYYFEISFNEDGIISIQSSSNNLNSYFNSYMDTFILGSAFDNDIELSVATPKNLTITYAVPYKLIMNNDLSTYLDNYNYYATPFQIYMIPFAVLGIFVVALTIFFIPFRYIKDNQFFKFIATIKFEILSILWSCLFCGITESLISIIRATTSHDIIHFYETFAIEYMEPYLTPIINIGIWFIFFSWFAILFYMIKYLIHKGLKAYYKENTCLYWIYKRSKNYILKLMDFDFQDDINKVILKIVIFNFIVIILILNFLEIGVLLVLGYSIAIFLLLKKKFNEIQDNYQVLLNATQQLSNGQFDYEINEDIGMFNPLKHEFSHIKDGFEKAVNEEVKSQRTKTELISNVSHDLKTPLTSIITYVDLLKNNSLEEQQRLEYLQVLERNSLRLKNLIDDLFEVSKANSGDVRLDIVDVDIISMLKQVELEYQDQFIANGLTIRYQYEQEKMICPLDSSKTYRIFENLFVNINKYALENTRVYIHIEDDDEYVKIIFRNISKDEMTFNENEIVERFVQGDKSRNTSGSGLGLAIVKSFTELQNGHFYVQLDGDLFKTIIQFKK